MNDLQNYLDHHYQTSELFANTCAISPEELDILLSQQLIPAPSYNVISDKKCISQAFGELNSTGLRIEKYFHPGNKFWVTLAVETKTKVGSVQAHADLKERFKQNFAAELKILNCKIFPLQDSFTENGSIISDCLGARTDVAWDYFLKGVFSLCVADPSSVQSIATKEVLQEALITLTQNGVKTDFNMEEKNHILNLIDQYEQAAMPFSPVEYPTSSRKRLVEDLRAKLITD
ncbi:DUF6058 family natural product biosynthesis protein [Paraglaciecola arctica]|uniref:Uncharacterized protein n=1 Tax=Paraglaciecola arctica BSs20135 TaxID=493475 RepID=K6ZAC0_9ALTE|nr:DUF6058 family natural product biosynthesis protein [Paraglaciecola arctica]GAC20375.1 hypothetical protein GARC_3417 [Paraglaciecola arctica BSs20135]